MTDIILMTIVRARSIVVTSLSIINPCMEYSNTIVDRTVEERSEAEQACVHVKEY
jgi:hypothetical protein